MISIDWDLWLAMAIPLGFLLILTTACNAATDFDGLEASAEGVGFAQQKYDHTPAEAVSGAGRGP